MAAGLGSHEVLLNRIAAELGLDLRPELHRHALHKAPRKPATFARLCCVSSSDPFCISPAMANTGTSSPCALYSTPLLRLDPNLPRSIRVLDLLQGPRRSSLHAKLRVVSLDASPCPYYEALSYTWGTGAPAESITVNEHHKLAITNNAYAALESLRRRRAVRTVWIDSICIDQANDAEKSVQVPLMGDVYRSAAVVNVWLGTASVCPTPALSLSRLFSSELWGRAWRDICSNLKAPTMRAEADDNRIGALRLLIRQQTIENIFSDLKLFWHALQGSHLALASAIKTNPPWHERLWIVQEYLLACVLRFGFGHHWVSCDAAFLLAWAGDDSDAVSSFTSAVGLAFEAARLDMALSTSSDGVTGHSHLSLCGLQNIIRTQQCFMPQDMVYGMLSLIDPYESALITVDYGLDPGVVFAQATHAVIRSETSFRVLDMVLGHGSSAEVGAGQRFPAWAVDFANFPKQGAWQKTDWRDADLAMRRTVLQKHCRVSADFMNLFIKAVPFDTILVQATVETDPPEEEDIVYKLLFSIIRPTLVTTLRARELGLTSALEHQHLDIMSSSLIAASLLTTQINADEVLELLGDDDRFSRRAHALLAVARPPPAANMTVEISGPGEGGDDDDDVDQPLISYYQINSTNADNDHTIEPDHGPSVVNAVKTAGMLWSTLCNTPVEMQRAGRIEIDEDEAKSFLLECGHLYRNATATSGGLSFFGTAAGGMVGVAPLGVRGGDLVVLAPDGETLLVLRRLEQSEQGEGDVDHEDGGSWRFMGQALVFSMHTPQSWERIGLADTVLLDEAPTFRIC